MPRLPRLPRAPSWALKCKFSAGSCAGIALGLQRRLRNSALFFFLLFPFRARVDVPDFLPRLIRTHNLKHNIATIVNITRTIASRILTIL